MLKICGSNAGDVEQRVELVELRLKDRAVPTSVGGAGPSGSSFYQSCASFFEGLFP